MAGKSDIKWAINILSQLKWLDGFPDSEGLIQVARRFIEIVCAVPGNTYEKDGGPDKEPETVVIPGLTRDEAAQWLIDEVARSRAKFPAPIEMRAIFERHFHITADGRKTGEFEGEPWTKHSTGLRSGT